jgi:hypothetical protein
MYTAAEFFALKRILDQMTFLKALRGARSDELLVVYLCPVIQLLPLAVITASIVW